MDLRAATWTDAAAAEADVALLPVGSTEQHGPHAPLGTDVLTAEAVAEAGADAADAEVVVAPTVPVGISEEHRRFDGTLWVREDAFRAYVRDVVRSLAANDWRRVVLVNGHGGNTDALREVAADLSRHEGCYAVAFTWFEAVDADVPMGHAGPVETALLRHVRPELVREDRVAEAREGAADRWGDWVAGVDLAHDVDEFADNGVVGDPAAGDADLGADLLEQAADALATLVAAVADRPVERTESPAGTDRGTEDAGDDA